MCNDTISLVVMYKGVVMASLLDVLMLNKIHTRRGRKNPQKKSHERMHRKVDRDDFLLAQIDEFREKAQQLQEILATKESKAQELQTIVKERELKADELQQILDERQEKADGITAEVAKQIDILIDRVNAKMQEIQQNMSAEMDNLSRSMTGEMGNLSRSMTGEMDNLSRNLNSDMNNIGRSLSGDIQSIEQSFGGSLEETRKITEEQTAQMRVAVNQANSQMLDTLGELNEQLQGLKQELTEKVHTENVKSFRNIQDLFKVLGEKLDHVNDLEESVKTIKVCVMGALVFGVMDFFGFLAIVLKIFGIL